MAIKAETRYYTAIHRLLPSKLYKEKMHNPFRGGTPDVWYSGTADDLWVEYKFISKVPVKAEIFVSKELSSLQMQWLNERHGEGRNVVVILGTPIGAWIYESGSWKHAAITRMSLIAAGLTKQDVADYIVRRTMLNEASKAAG